MFAGRGFVRAQGMGVAWRGGVGGDGGVLGGWQATGAAVLAVVNKPGGFNWALPGCSRHLTPAPQEPTLLPSATLPMATRRQQPGASSPAPAAWPAGATTPRLPICPI